MFAEPRQRLLFAAPLSGHNPNSRVSDDTAALSGYNLKAPGFAGGYLLVDFFDTLKKAEK
jgi:hypothetical protein